MSPRTPIGVASSYEQSTPTTKSTASSFHYQYDQYVAVLNVCFREMAIRTIAPKAVLSR